MCIVRNNLFSFSARGRHFVGGGLLLTSGIVTAAPPPPINPSSLEPGVIGRSIANSPNPLATSEASKFILPQKLKPSPTGLSAEAGKISFVLNGVILKGNHVFTTSELQTIFQPYVHHKITLAKLQELVQAITDKYQEKGYFLSKALLPPQEIKNGTVQITVVEGFISEINVQGIKRKALIAFIQKYGNKIKEIKPIRLDALERYLLLMNDVPGFNIKSVLEPDPKVPLGAKLTLVTVRTPLQAIFTYDNYQTPYLGPDETTLFASLNSVFLPGGTLYARVLSAYPNRKLNYYELRHDQTIGTQGLVLGVDAYVTKTNPQFILTPLDVRGVNTDINTTVSYPIIRSKKRNLSISGQFDAMNNNSNILGQQIYNDQIRDLAFTGRYSDTVWKGDDSLNIYFNKGLNGLGASRGGVRSRPGAVVDYFRIVASASREQHLSDRFSLFALVTGQYANNILPSAVNFLYGGPYLGRGYDWVQFNGDEGVAGKAEFRMNTSPNLPFLKQVQYYAFYDVGQLWSLIPGITSVSGASTGLGFRANLMNHFNAEGFLGKPLTAPNASQVVKGNSGHSFLAYFQVSAYI